MYPSRYVREGKLNSLYICNYSANPATAQIALYFVQEQGESAEFTGVNEHFQHSYWTKQRAS
jgi:hypothetical protein